MPLEDMTNEDIEVKIAEKLDVFWTRCWASDMNLLLDLVEQLNPERFDIGRREGKWGCFVLLKDHTGVCLMGHSQPTAARAGALALYLALISNGDQQT